MCFERNVNGNRDVKILECNYLLVQRGVKLALVSLPLKSELREKKKEKDSLQI